MPLLPLWAVRPAQSLSVCIRVHFTLLYIKYKLMLVFNCISDVLSTGTGFIGKFCSFLRVVEEYGPTLQFSRTPGSNPRQATPLYM